MDLKARYLAFAYKHQVMSRKHKTWRDKWIYSAAKAGASTREIARELDLTHGYIARIIRNVKQGEES